ncbi:MAG: branched-chain amino acid ABC transporter permease [Dethiobacter sp.]|nr:branched-chain amino acid ABC transporter permease [Dethiobacter sp.]
MNKLNNKGFVLFLFLVVIAFLAPLVITNSYTLHILITIFIWSMLTLGIRLIMLVGHLNAAQAGIFGMGAYASALLAIRLDLSFWLALPLAGIFCALLAIPIGYPTLRIKGTYFVMATFALTEVFRMIWMRWSGLFGGPRGISGIPRPDAINFLWLNIRFVGKVPFYYLGLILMLITIIFMYRIDNSRIGKTFRCIPQAELLAECIGINILKHKVIALVIGSFFAGMAGSFYAHYSTYISPWDYTWMKSTQMLMYAVVGGTSAVAGPVLGSFVLIGLEEWLRPLQEYVPIFTGVILILVLRFLPGGLLSIPEKVSGLTKKEGFITIPKRIRAFTKR